MTYIYSQIFTLALSPTTNF